MIGSVWRVAGLAALLALTLLCGRAGAVGEDVFVVPRVPVQAQGDSPSAAKAAAQDMGRRRAMDILLRRLTIEEDWAYLPRLAVGEPAQAESGLERSAILLTGADLETLESGFEVYGEKSSATTYRAYITYRFKPEAVRRLLKEARIPYSETQTRPALIIPVLQTNNGVYLWEENNPWMAAWKSRPYINELTPMTAPLGDLEDGARISATQALNLDPVAIEAIAAHYGVSQVIVAHARLQQAAGQDQLTVRLINGFRETATLAADESVTPDIEEYVEEGAAEDLFPAGTPAEIVSSVGDVLAEIMVAGPTGNFPALAEAAIESAIAKYASGWKAQTLIDHSSEAVLEVSAFFESIGEWTKIRAGLNATPIVSAVQVFALSPKGAEMRLKVFGDPSRLVVAMENYGVALWTEDQERWLLATPERAGAIRGSRWLRQRRGVFSDAEDYDQEDLLQNASEVDGEEGADLKIETPR